MYADHALTLTDEQLVNVVTSFDMLNEASNAGSLAMNEWSACLRQQGVCVVSFNPIVFCSLS
jgi:hypothetical protein